VTSSAADVVKRRLWFLSAAPTIFFLIPAFSQKLTAAQTTETTTTTTTAEGSEIYAAKCAACHGSTGEGDIGPSLQENSWSQSRIASIVTNGDDAMPAITDLSSEQIQTVALHAVGLQVAEVTTSTTTTLAPVDTGETIEADSPVEADSAAPVEADSAAPVAADEIADEDSLVTGLLIAFLVAGGALMGGVLRYLWRARTPLA